MRRQLVRVEPGTGAAVCRPVIITSKTARRAGWKSTGYSGRGN